MHLTRLEIEKKLREKMIRRSPRLLALITTLLISFSHQRAFASQKADPCQNGDIDDLVKIYEVPQKIHYLNATQASSLIARSRIVGVHFDNVLTTVLQKQNLSSHASSISARGIPQPCITPTTTTSTDISDATIAITPRAHSILPDEATTGEIIRQGSAIHCGEANPNGRSNRRLVLSRIVGGRKTEPGEFPFQVRLSIRSIRGSGICGGVILDEYHILTAAHCMTACTDDSTLGSKTITIATSGVRITIGDHSIRYNDGEVELDVASIIPHEKYDACTYDTNDNDIALIKINTPIEFKFTADGYGSINRPCLPKSNSTNYRDGEMVIVSGWGVTRENTSYLSNILRYVQVPMVNLTSCQEVYGSRVNKDHICAGYKSGGKDSCQGDSGGPLVRITNNKYELVGVVSFGYGCGQPDAPGVYTKVASYIDWISANKQ